MYFVRVSSGNEVDVVIEKEGLLIPIEIKSATKIDSSNIKNLYWFQKFYRQNGGIVISKSNDKKELAKDIVQMNWQEVAEL